MPSFARKSSRSKKQREYAALQDSKAKPGLAVDTSFSRHRGQQPQQVFPRIITRDKNGLFSSQEESSVAKVQPDRPHAHTLPLVPDERATAVPEATTSAAPDVLPALHKRIKGLRPSPLDLTTDVSPSDRAIPIGIEVPSNTVRQPHRQGGDRVLPSPTSNGRELPTPTIIVTPAREDFDCRLTASPEELRHLGNRRPTSSVYSRHTNATLGATDGRTPPVPPLPLFAAQSNAHLHVGSNSVSVDRSAPMKTGDGEANGTKGRLSLQTVFGDEPTATLHTRSADSKRSTAASLASRRSKGWWNVITSPFSPPGKSIIDYLRSPLSSSNKEDEDRTPILSGASKMPYSRLGELLLKTPSIDELEPHSASESSRRGSLRIGSAAPRSTPQRSFTAPGALDMGDADMPNIYRRPSRGAAASYYKRNSNFPGLESTGGSIGATRSLAEEGWSPSHSCYRASTEVARSTDDGGMRDSEFYTVPPTGEAAEYFNTNKRFPSLAPYGEGFGEKGLQAWDPRDSVAHPPIKGSVDGAASASPMQSSRGTGSQTISARSSLLSESSFGDQTPVAMRPPYPDHRNPFDDAHAAKREDQAQTQDRAYETDMTPKSGEATAFKDFSATHPAAFTFRSPSLHASNPRPSSMQRQASDDVLSPLETPQVEQAQTATFMAPDAHREVDVVSTRQPTPTPPTNGLGIATNTMTSRGESDFEPSQSEKDTPYQYEPRDAWVQRGVPVAFDDHHDSNSYARSQGLSEKASFSTAGPFEDPEEEAGSRSTNRSCSRRFWLWLSAVLVFLIAVLVVLLVVFLPYPTKAMPVQAQWLNLTGFPPLPTGVSTVVQPKTVQQVNGCVSQESLWSCAVPPNEGSEEAVPNFRFQIRFRDGIVPSNETAILPSNTTLSRRELGHAAVASQHVRRNLWKDPVYVSSPAPPSTDDQRFLGRTTDNTTAPLVGEETPFYISLLNATALTPSSSSSSKLSKRDWQYPYPTPSHTSPNDTATKPAFHYPGQSTAASSPASEAAQTIPQAAEQNHHLPAAAELYPLAYAQPLRLYNRGQSTEHYGFYTYFDRSLYVSSVAGSNTTTSNSTIATNINGNVPLEDATAVCTWSQTRLLVQIWTRRPDVAALSVSPSEKVPAFKSSANDMKAPGSFPYQVTVTLDRHGGDASKKGVYCHSLDDEQHVLQDVRTWVEENRAFGGHLVNPAGVPTNNGMVSNGNDIDTNDGGIDGGTGGCMCQWSNSE